MAALGPVQLASGPDAGLFWDQRFAAWRSMAVPGPVPLLSHGVDVSLPPAAFPSGTEVDARMRGSDGWHNAIVLSSYRLPDSSVQYFVEYDSHAIFPRHAMLMHWDIQSRADRSLTAVEVKPGDMVLANYNFSRNDLPGNWYDAVVTRVDYRRDGTARMWVRIYGPDHQWLPKEVVPFGNHVYEVPKGGQHASWHLVASPRKAASYGYEHSFDPLSSGHLADAKSHRKSAHRDSGARSHLHAASADVPRTAIDTLDSPLRNSNGDELPPTPSETRSAQRPRTVAQLARQRQQLELERAEHDKDDHGFVIIGEPVVRRPTAPRRKPSLAVKKLDLKSDEESRTKTVWRPTAPRRKPSVAVKILDLESDEETRAKRDTKARVPLSTLSPNRRERSPLDLSEVPRPGVDTDAPISLDDAHVSQKHVTPLPDASITHSTSPVSVAVASYRPLPFRPQSRAERIQNAVRNRDLAARLLDAERQCIEADLQKEQQAKEAALEALMDERTREKEEKRAERLKAVEARRARRREEKMLELKKRMLARGEIDEFDVLPEGTAPLPDDDCLAVVDCSGGLDVGGVLMVAEFLSTFGNLLQIRRSISKGCIESALLAGEEGYGFLVDIQLPLIKEIYGDETEELAALDRKSKVVFSAATFPSVVHAIIRDLGDQSHAHLVGETKTVEYIDLNPSDKLAICELLCNLTLSCSSVADAITEAAEQVSDARRIFRQEEAEERKKYVDAKTAQILEEMISLDHGDDDHSGGETALTVTANKPIVGDAEAAVAKLKGHFRENTREQRALMGAVVLGSDRRARRHMILPSGVVDGVLVQADVGGASMVEPSGDGGDGADGAEVAGRMRLGDERYFVLPTQSQVEAMTGALLAKGDCEGRLKRKYAEVMPEILDQFAQGAKTRRKLTLSGSYAPVVKQLVDAAIDFDRVAAEVMDKCTPKGDLPASEPVNRKSFEKLRSKFSAKLSKATRVQEVCGSLLAHAQEIATLFTPAWPESGWLLINDKLKGCTSSVVLLELLKGLMTALKTTEGKILRATDKASSDSADDSSSGTDSPTDKRKRRRNYADAHNSAVDARAERAARRQERDEGTEESESTSDSPDEDEFEVEAIIDRRVVRGVEKFLIKWKGYPASENTWEPRENILSDLLIEDFEREARRKASLATSADEAASDSFSTTRASRGKPTAPRRKVVPARNDARTTSPPTDPRVEALRVVRGRADSVTSDDSSEGTTGGHRAVGTRKRAADTTDEESAPRERSVCKKTYIDKDAGVGGERTRATRSAVGAGAGPSVMRPRRNSRRQS